MRWTGLLACALVLFTAPVARAANGGYDCLIEPSLVVSVGFPVDGVLESVRVDRGDLVKKGDLLATLDSTIEKTTLDLARARTELQANLKASDARYELGVRRWQRVEELFKQNLVPLREMHDAETQKALAEVGVLEAREGKRLAELELRRAEAALAVRRVRSPVDGVVVERVLSTGEFTRQGPVVKIAQIDPLRVEVIVPVSQLGKITVGLRAQVTPEGPVREPLSARVKVVDRVADAASGTFGVRLEVPNGNYRIPAGLKCKVRFLD